MTHLSSGQISEWMLGERGTEVKQHVQTCKECHEEIARLQDGLLAFRQSVRDWAEQRAEQSAEQPNGASIGSIAKPRLSWGWAAGAAALIGAALLPMYFDVREAQYEAKTAQDSLLLLQVHAHLTRTVPQPMEHLMDLMNEKVNDGNRGPQ